MKVLPDYLIKIMPQLEEAMEELRLSVIDHAYDLLLCLDADELNTDDVRHKLELYNLKIENMTESWLPNGRFYRIYPLIKYNRTRLNSIKSVVSSGGQFEGLWSSDFSTKPEYNYKSISTMRHYMIKSPLDGYFYISGDAERNLDGTIASSALTALSSDILVNQAMPAGYTYLYVPWPRPTYPVDSGYLYNINMLMCDRLHYTKDCSEPYDSYSESKPASLKNENPTPYWFNYKYMNGVYDSGIVETGTYYDKYGNTSYEWTPEVVKFVPDDSCKILYDSNATFPTNCYIHSTNITTLPDSEQSILLIDSDGSSYTRHINQHLDETIYDMSYTVDLLSKLSIKQHMPMSAFQEFRPMWTEVSPIFNTLQSSYINDGLTHVSHSTLNEFNYKEEFSAPTVSATIKLNNDLTVDQACAKLPDLVHTNAERCTLGHLDEIEYGYLQPASNNQGDNRQVFDDIIFNQIYHTNSSNAIPYDPSLSYTILNVGVYDYNNHEQTLNSGSDISMFLIGDPLNRTLYIERNNDVEFCNFITYKVSKLHTLWFSPNHANTIISDRLNTLYNNVGSDLLLRYPHTNDVGFTYKIYGIYKADGSKIDDPAATVECFIDGASPATARYHVVFNKGTGEYNEAAYVVFSVETFPGEVPNRSPEERTVFSQKTGETLTALYVKYDNSISVDDGETWMSLDSFYENYLMVTGSETRYFGNESVIVYTDDGSKV